MNDKPSQANSASGQKSVDPEIVSAFTLALDGVGCAVTIQDHELTYLHLENLASVWRNYSPQATDDVAIFGAILGKKLIQAKQALLASGLQQKLTTHEANKVISFSLNLMAGADGSKRIITTVQDITKVRRREKAMRTLLLEVSHRSKNLLAIIQALASQSAKHANSETEFVPAFTARLHAVSAAQDVIVDSNWQGASIHELAKRQLAVVSADKDIEISYHGEDLELDANQALYAGLAFHELAMLIATHPSQQMRRIVIGAGGNSHAFIEWKSEPGLNMPQLEHGFGPTLLEKVVPAALSGKIEFRVSSEAVEWRVDFPLRGGSRAKPQESVG